MFSVNRKKQLELLRFQGISSRSDGVHRRGPRYISMIRRILLPALALIAAAMAAAEPASAQRGRGDGGDGGGDRERRRDRGDGDDRGRDRMFQVQGSPGNQWAPPGEPQEREVPLGSILRDLRQRYGGQQLDTSKSGDRYVIQWLTQDGRRLTIEVDAATGRVISTRG
jgi:hypothetical protein